jgi:hypothetical protein
MQLAFQSKKLIDFCNQYHIGLGHSTDLLPIGEWAGRIFKQNLGKHHQENVAGKQEIVA